MTDIRETQGSDRCKHGQQCRQHHDLAPWNERHKAGCCCCNPCTHVRPYDIVNQISEEPDPEMRRYFYEEPKLNVDRRCCKCVPRELYLYFTPDEETGTGENPCCREYAVRMVHHPNPLGLIEDYGNADRSLWNISSYLGSFFGVTVNVYLGWVGDGQTGTGSDTCGCGWQVIAEYEDAEIFNETYPIRHGVTRCAGYEQTTGTGTGTGSSYYEEDDNVCYQPPTSDDGEPLVIATGIPGTNNCTYSVSLRLGNMTQIPFQQDSDVRAFHDAIISPLPECVDASGRLKNTLPECNPKIIPLCGECEHDADDALIIPSCLSISTNVATGTGVSGAYLEAGTLNGTSYFVDGDRQLYWNGIQWLIDENGSTLATGPATECPIGIWTWVQDPDTGTGTDDVGNCFCVRECNTYFVKCGCCDTVCSRICVRGRRHATQIEPDSFLQPSERSATFTWFEDWADSGELLSRGWRYYNRDSDKVERIFLEGSDGGKGSILVDGVAWKRSLGIFSFGAHTVCDPDDYEKYYYWRGTLDGATSYIYLKSDLSTWALMKGWNEIAEGPVGTDFPYGDYPSTVDPYPTYVVSEDAPEENHCILRPCFEENPDEELYAERVIDSSTNGCGAGLNETLNDQLGYGYEIEIRCGFCTCWTYWCEWARCAPSQLCATYWVGSEHTTATMAWDNDIKGWASDDLPFQLLLQRNWDGSAKTVESYPADSCIIVPYMVGPLTGTGTGTGYSPPSDYGHYRYQSGNEAITKVYDWDTHVIDYLYSDYENDLFIYATSQAPDCAPGPCSMPCMTNCTNPDTLYAVIRQGTVAPTGPEDPNYPYPTDEWEVELKLVQFYQYLDFPQQGCFYLGYIPGIGGSPGPLEKCCGVAVYLLATGYFYLRFETQGCNNPPTDCYVSEFGDWQAGACTGGVMLDFECDPMYGTGNMEHVPKIHQNCLYPHCYNNPFVCGEVTTEIEVTE